MSVKVMSLVWDQSESTENARLLLLAIADSADHDGTNAWLAIDTLAKKTRSSRSAVKRNIKVLVSLGELAVVSGPSHIRADRRPNGYEIHLPGLITPVIDGGPSWTVVEERGSMTDATGVHDDADGGPPVDPNPSLPTQTLSEHFAAARAALTRSSKTEG